MKQPPPHPMHPYHSDRPVDSRWHRVSDLIDCGRRPYHEYDDTWIRRGWAYLVRFRACRAEHDRERLTHDFPDIDAAYRLYTAADKLDRAIVEARFLARQPVADIAVATSLTIEAIEAYEALFFQVLGALNAPIFILTEAVGMNLTGEGLRETDTDILLKLIAYRAGPASMEIALRYFRRGLQIPDSFEDATLASLNEFAAMMEIRGVVLAQVLPFPQCNRGLVLLQLADEVRAYAKLRSSADGCGQSALGEMPVIGNTPPGTPHANHQKQRPFSPSPDWWLAVCDAVLTA